MGLYKKLPQRTILGKLATHPLELVKDVLLHQGLRCIIELVNHSAINQVRIIAPYPVEERYTSQSNRPKMTSFTPLKYLSDSTYRTGALDGLHWVCMKLLP